MPTATRKPTRARVGAATAGRRWDEPIAAPMVLVRGPEEYLRELAVAGVKAKAVERHGPLEVIELSASSIGPGDLAVATSPSLFAEPKLVVLTGLEVGAAADADLIAYAANPNPDATVVVVHAGGVRGKKALEAIIASGAPVLECAEVKKDADKAAFATNLFRQHGRKAEPAAVSALLDAAGSDLRSLAAAVDQLVADTAGAITAQAVHEYHGGRVEATGFQVADAAINGDAVLALKLFRHALAVGLTGPELTGALAVKLRGLAKAAAVQSREVTARDVGMQDWQLRTASANLRKWRPDQLAAAIEAVANADYVVKGGQTKAGGAHGSPQYVLESALLAVALRRVER